MCEKKSINIRRLGLPSSPVVLIRLGSVLFVGLMIGHMSAYPWTSTFLHTAISILFGSRRNSGSGGRPTTEVAERINCVCALRNRLILWLRQVLSLRSVPQPSADWLSTGF